MLQNADDAKSKKFKILKINDLLYVANNGRKFSSKDLENLCRSASSNKVRGDTIGYRGIGFKSVVGFSGEIHLLSGDLKLTFSKTRTKTEIPEASRVPLIRIPHKMSDRIKKLIKPTLDNLKEEGFSTIFVFTDVAEKLIQFEFDCFDYNTLIFLKHITETEINVGDKIFTKIQKKSISNSELDVTSETNGNRKRWYVSNKKDSSVAFLMEDGQVRKLPREEALVHAFLPTEDCSGFGVLINGNFSTDPSRRHLIYDRETDGSIELCSSHLIGLIEQNVKKNTKESIKIINALVPGSDPRILQFTQNSFLNSLLAKIKQEKNIFIKNLKLCPNWLNYSDFKNIVDSNKYEILASGYLDIEGFCTFMKFLGATEINFNDIKENINSAEISILGCAQLTHYIFKSILSFNRIKEPDFLNLNILHSQGKRVSLETLKNNGYKLDPSFVSLLLENSLTEFDINQVLKKYSFSETIESKSNNSTLEQKEAERRLSDSTIDPTIPDFFSKPDKRKQISLKYGMSRWRSAEEQTLELLNSHGFSLEDVSKQNIGYDLGGRDPKGNKIQIEVKSISGPGQKFRMTNNEVAVAQENKSTYYVAVVRQTGKAFEIAMIPDPTNNLILNRQCVQWIWECDNYEYKPIKFDLSK